MKTEVYSWRLSGDLKSDLEREARSRKVPVSSILEIAVREWLDKDAPDLASEAAQRELQQSAASCFGTFSGGRRRRAETARSAVRERLGRRRAG